MSEKRTLKGNIFTDRGRLSFGTVEISDGKIVSVEIESDTAREGEQYIFPGFTDIHTHGCVGHDTCDADVSGVIKMAEFEKSQGVTSYFPTTMTFDEERLTKVVKAVAEAKKTATNIKGIYMEGPFISREKCGAQNPLYIAKPDFEMVERLNAASGGIIRFIVVAPETEGAFEFIEKSTKKYAVSIAHTTADYTTSMKAISLGANQVTHFYNAMPSYTHRAPGVVGAAMDSDNSIVELICDGIHVHPAVVRNTFKYFGAHRIMLISDSMEATGMPNGKYALGGQDVYVTDRRATLKDGTIAGSASTLWDCFKQVIAMGISMEEALTSAAVTPAKRAGLFDRTGSITVGKDADIIIASKDLEIVEVI